MNIVMVGTHSSQKTGYARVMRGLVPRLGPDVKVYGVQACGPSELADGIEVDAREFGNDGFSFGGLRTFVESRATDAVILYNDPVVLKRYLEVLEGADVRVYLYVDLVNTRISERHWPTFSHPLVRGVMVFSDCWKREILKIPGFSKPVVVVTHAVDVPIIQNARIQGCGDDVVFLNMNRNTKRKRLDVYATAAARFLAKNPDAPVRFLANSHHEEAFDLHSITIRELVACGVSVGRAVALAGRVMINRSVLSDDTVNYLHNACDVAVNCSEGEGFGLCVAEAASVGKPVIVSGVGGAADLFARTSLTAPSPAWVIPPVAEYFVDGRDGIGGCAELISVDSLVTAFAAFMLPENRKMYGDRARIHMSSRPTWEDIADTIRSFVTHAR